MTESQVNTLWNAQTKKYYARAENELQLLLTCMNPMLRNREVHGNIYVYLSLETGKTSKTVR